MTKRNNRIGEIINKLGESDDNESESDNGSGDTTGDGDNGYDDGTGDGETGDPDQTDGGFDDFDTGDGDLRWVPMAAMEEKAKRRNRHQTIQPKMKHRSRG